MSKVIRRTAETCWPLNSGWGSHRALVQVDRPADAVRVHIEWRRRDENPDKIGVRIMNLTTGEEIHSLYIVKSDRMAGEIIFKAPNEGLYGIYYLPFEIKGEIWYFPQVEYLKKEEMDKDELWSCNPEDELPEAKLIAIESRTDFDAFHLMEIPASDEETEILKNKYSDEGFILFPEDRINPIRMLKEIPQLWADRGPSDIFNGEARPGEYYVFQIGVWAFKEVQDLKVVFENISGVNEKELPEITCFNTGGTDWLGNRFTKTVTVAAGNVQALWCGVDLHLDFSGTLEFDVKIKTDCNKKTVHISLNVDGEVISNHGDADLWRFSRLRWLNSGIGTDGEPTKDFLPLKVEGNSVSCLGRDVSFGDTGLPSVIRSFFSTNVDCIGDNATDIIGKPVEINLIYNNRIQEWKTISKNVNKISEGSVTVSAEIRTAGLTGNVKTVMEYDGHLDTFISLTAERDVQMDDFQLVIPYTKEASPYMMGMGWEGGLRPEEWQYEWNIDRANNMVWIGAAHAGMQVKLKHTEDVWELYNYNKQGLPEAWSNEGNGSCSFNSYGELFALKAHTGPRSLKAGESITWRFSLLITPFKLLDTNGHWKQRYHHIDSWGGIVPSLEEAAEAGATIVNLHQGGAINAFINYPFYNSKDIREQAQKAHAMNLKYKIYYTIRELSTHAMELWAVRSLGDEILRDGPGFHIADHFSKEKHQLMTGGPWLCEHLVEGFVPGWQQLLHNGEYDSALAMTGLSRWHNHYLEGLAWLMSKDDLDGIYLDGVGFDRTIMKRVRKTMERAKEGSLIDFHSGNNYEVSYGLNSPMNQYLELMPSIDSLWMGEMYDYEGKPPEFWLLEVSGVPFGLMGDMLQNGGNPWRGMVFGMSCRFGWQQGGDPVPMWRFWDTYGMDQSKMLGWWSPECPVSTGNSDVKATAFVKPGSVLISIASWAPQTVHVKLEINWAAIGLTEVDSLLEIPPIENFQPGKTISSDELLPVEPAKGWLIVIRKK